MGHQIIKQPNGLYAVYSSIVDDFILIDATPQEIIDDRIEYYKEKVTKDVTEIVAKLERGEKPYYQRTMTFDEAVQSVKTMAHLLKDSHA